ncbi:flavodoxin family protein [Chloroflexota bacterium]
MSTRVIGIMGSPRRGGNTDILLDEVLAAASEAGAETTKYVIGALNIRPCYELYHCAVDGTCTIQDDMLDLYEQLTAADCVVLASPIFFYGIPSQTKALIDRCQALWVRRHVLKSWQPDVARRKGGLISVGATKGPRLFDGVTLTAKYFFDAIGVTYAEELLVKGVDAKGEVRESPSYLQDARALGARLVEP